MRAVLLAGGLGVATLIGALFAYNKTRKTERIPRQLVLSTAKSLRQHMFLSMVEIACFVKENAIKFPPDQLREHILDQSSSFMKNMREKLSQVFKEFTQEQYQQNVEKFYKNDLQVQYHLKRYQEEFDKAILGVTPEFRQQIVTFFTAEKLLQITKEFLEAKLVRLTEKINEKITFQQMVIILRAQKEEEKTLRSSKLKEAGLVGKDDEIAAIYEFAIGKYLKIDTKFKTQYEKLVEDYRIRANEHVDQFCAFPRSTSKKNIALETDK